MKTTQKQLNDMVKEICDLSGLKNNRNDAIKSGQDKYLAIDYTACYGGYRLVMIKVEGGGQYGAFNWGSTCPRIKASEFSERLEGLIAGLEYAKHEIMQ
jgi:hypothetical protein